MRKCRNHTDECERDAVKAVAAIIRSHPICSATGRVRAPWEPRTRCGQGHPCAAGRPSRRRGKMQERLDPRDRLAGAGRKTTASGSGKGGGREGLRKRGRTGSSEMGRRRTTVNRPAIAETTQATSNPGADVDRDRMAGACRLDAAFRIEQHQRRSGVCAERREPSAAIQRVRHKRPTRHQPYRCAANGRPLWW